MVREKQQTILTQQDNVEKAIPYVLKVIKRVEVMFEGEERERHQYALKIDQHLREIYKTKIGKPVQDDFDLEKVKNHQDILNRLFS